MKQALAAQSQRENQKARHNGDISHLAVRAVADHEMPSGLRGGASTSHSGHDFSQAAVRPGAAMVGRDYGAASCPAFPRTCPFGGACHTCPARVQAKLTINKPGDKYEQEADRIADLVMRMPEPRPQCQVDKKQDEEELLQTKAIGHRRLAGEVAGLEAPSIVQEALHSPGQPLDAATRTFMELRLGHDLSQVRVHTGTKATQSAQEVNALAYTVGKDVVFGAGQFEPDTQAGKRLIAHELTHVLQQEKGVPESVIQRRSGCSSSQDTTITDDHSRAMDMLATAIAAVRAYNGTTPTKVYNALSTHFHGATSNAFAAWINLNLRYLWVMARMAGYECYTGGLFERFWACGPNDLATTFWCVPRVDIRLCPAYFQQSETGRSTTLIHEWVHKYGCNFDLGYEHEEDYSGNWTVTQLLNADSFSSFVRDVQ